MKKLFTILLILVSFSVFSQTWNRVFYRPGYQYNGLKIDSIAILPNDTLRNKVVGSIAVKNNQLYIKETNKWKMLTGVDILSSYRLLNNHDSLSTLEEKSYNSLDNKPDLSVYAKRDSLALKVDKVTGKQLSTEDYSTAEKTKLAGIASGAEVNVNADWDAISGDAQIINKPTIPTSLPTPNLITFNNSGTGDASGTTFNGSLARTISYNTLGAQAAGDYITIKSFLPIFYDKSEWSDLSDFTSNDVSASVSSGNIVIKANDLATLDNSLDIKGASCLENWRQTIRYKVNTSSNSSSHGIGIGIRSSNSHVSSSIVAYIDLSTDPTHGHRLIISTTYPTNFIGVAESESDFNFSSGDSIEITFERIGVRFLASGRNITTNSVPINLEYTFSTTYNPSQQILPNTGKFAVFAFDNVNDYNVYYLNVIKKEIVNPDILLLGDSKTVGYNADYANNWCSLLRKNFHNTVNSSGGGDRTAEILSRMPEIISINPKQVLLEIGTNEPGDTSNFKVNYKAITDSLLSHNIKVFHLLPFYQNSEFNYWTYRYILNNYESESIIDTYTATKVNGFLSPDGAHPSDYGDNLIYSAIIKSGKLQGAGSRIIDSYAPLSGSNNYIRNQTTPQDANLNVIKGTFESVSIGDGTINNPAGDYKTLMIDDQTEGSSPAIRLTNDATGNGAGNGWTILVGNAAGGGTKSISIYSADSGANFTIHVGGSEKFRVSADGVTMYVPEYADNAAAISAGKTSGFIYRTGDLLKIVH